MDEEEYQWAYQVPGYGNRRAAVGPGREYVYLNAEGKLIVLEVDSGDIVGELPATAAFKESRYHQFKEVWFSPNGALMAASFGSVGTNVPVAVWNLEQGALVGDYVLSKKLAAVLDDRYLLYGDCR